MTYLLDTSIVSSPISRSPDPWIVKRLRKDAHRCALAAPVWHELTYGCRRLPIGKRREALETYLRDVVHPLYSILPYDEPAAAWHGHERARLEAIGRPTPFADGQIAAIAVVNGLTLVTVNARDFVDFASLHVEDWSKR